MAGNDGYSRSSPQDSPHVPERKIEDPLWRIRLRLLRTIAAQELGMFLSNRIGVIGLAMIVLFALMAIAHPILMATVWPSQIYDPISGYDAPVVDKTIVEVVTDPATQIDLATARLAIQSLRRIR